VRRRQVFHDNCDVVNRFHFDRRNLRHDEIPRV
jgi:hypothetical protein